MNTEPTPATADQKPMSDEQIEKRWHDTFSTSNPYCPCNLKSFTKAVRAAERWHGITEIPMCRGGV